VLGSGFGLEPSHVESITVGEKACPRVEWKSQSELLIAVPPGVGADQEVRVVLSSGLGSNLYMSPNSRLSYSLPEVQSISPQYIFTAAVKGNFDIVGKYFGNEPNDVEEVRIGD